MVPDFSVRIERPERQDPVSAVEAVVAHSTGAEHGRQ
jgi:hypothetical protein